MKIIKLNLMLILGLILFTFAIISSANAANTIYVNGTSGNDANNGTSWTYAKATIQNGVNTVSSGGNVYVANGVYKENLKINNDINLYGESKDSTIIDGNHSASVINISSNFVGISNFTVKNGDWTSYGGGIYNNANAIITNCNIANNRALDGGGIYNAYFCYIYDSLITGNTASYEGGGIKNLGQCYLYNTLIISNTAPDGGGICNLAMVYADSLTYLFNNHPDDVVGNAIIPISSPGKGSNSTVNNNSSNSNISPNSKNPLVNAVSSIRMQKTGLPIIGLILAILVLFGGLASSKRK